MVQKIIIHEVCHTALKPSMSDENASQTELRNLCIILYHTDFEHNNKFITP